jgi:hypothetical protein
MTLREKVFFLFSTAAKNGQLGDQCLLGKNRDLKNCQKEEFLKN